jgi:selenide,water dikinase
LGQVIARLPVVDDPALLVGSDTLDDAAVYRLNDELALVQTVDFFTPVVDDPYDYGRIAAANAFSDIYALGASPLTALNIVAFPCGVPSLEYLGPYPLAEPRQRAASPPIVGGHTIDDPEPKYDWVTGVIKPGEEPTSARAACGDLLVLTKPLGTGIIATAIKLGRASEETIAVATASMAELNRAGAEVAREHGVRALTDITGFGLLGHLSEMCRASGVGVDLWFDRLPLLPEAAELARQGVVPGGTKRNLEYVEPWTVFSEPLEPWQRFMCADAQTSGGLVMAVPPDRVDAVLRDLAARRTPAAAVIGRVRSRGDVMISVLTGGEGGA